MLYYSTSRLKIDYKAKIADKFILGRKCFKIKIEGIYNPERRVYSCAKY